jgi:hypothetical protein
MSPRKPASPFTVCLSGLTFIAIFWSSRAIAQTIPSYASSVPSYATTELTIHGQIASIDDQYKITVHDDNGYLDHVALHQGTVINPTGVTLAPGMTVTIHGYNGGSVFEANEIDTPYTSSGQQSSASYSVGVAAPGFAFSFGYGYGYPAYYSSGYGPYAYGPAYGIFVGPAYYPYYYRSYYRPYYPYRYRPYGYGYGGYGYPRPYRGYPAYPYRYGGRSYLGGTPAWHHFSSYRG